MQKPTRLGAISNLWPYPVEHIFETLALGIFEHLIYSYDFHKPDPRIFAHAVQRFGVEPQHCLMVGDSLASDIRGALSAGMSAALINRSGRPAINLPAGVLEITSLNQLL